MSLCEMAFPTQEIGKKTHHQVHNVKEESKI